MFLFALIMDAALTHSSFVLCSNSEALLHSFLFGMYRPPSLSVHRPLVRVCHPTARLLLNLLQKLISLMQCKPVVSALSQYFVPHAHGRFSKTLAADPSSTAHGLCFRQRFSCA